MRKVNQMSSALWIPFPVQGMSKSWQTEYKVTQPTFSLGLVSLGRICRYRQKAVRKYNSVESMEK